MFPLSLGPQVPVDDNEEGWKEKQQVVSRPKAPVDFYSLAS